MRLTFYFAFSALIVGAFSCAPSPALMRLDPMDTSSILDRVEERTRSIRLMEAEGSLTVESPEQSGTASFELQYVQPDTIWMKMTGPFGVSVGTLMLSRHRFVFYNARQNRRISGRPDAETLARVFNVPLSFDYISSGIVGSAANATLLMANADASIDSTHYLLRRLGDGGQSELWIDGSSFVVTRYNEIDATGAPVISASASRLNYVNGLTMPHLVRFVIPRQNQALTIAYRSIRINGQRQKTFFLPDEPTKTNTSDTIR